MFINLGMDTAAARSYLERLLEATEYLRADADPALLERLREVNRELWDLEDAVRSALDTVAFARTALAISRTNDRRASIKKELDLSLRASHVDHKIYATEQPSAHDP